MTRSKVNKIPKTKLTEKQKKQGKIDIYILIGMIVVGLVLGLYYMH
jgi:hypothetical protein